MKISQISTLSKLRFSLMKSVYASPAAVNHASHRRLLHSESTTTTTSHTSFSKVTNGVLKPQSSFSRNQKYPTSISSCLIDRNDTHFVSLSQMKPISGVSPRCLHSNNNPLSSLRLGTTSFHSYGSGMSGLGLRSYSSFFGGKGDDLKEPQASGEDSGGVGVGGDWDSNLKGAWQSAVDGASYMGEKAKGVSDELCPHVQQLLDANPYIKEVIIPVGWTFTGTMLAWLVMPKVLRKLHKYSMQSPVALLSGKLPSEQIPYERSLWGALEDPVRYLITFMAFLQLGVMIAPTTIADQYIAQTWRGAVILSAVWFIHRWKTNVFTRALANKNVMGLDREKLLTLDKLSSVGLFVLGSMSLAEACGVAVQSILTVGGIGGVATAFAAKDILGNVLSGLSMQFSKPFSLGDTIKAGSIEGQVIEMGLTTTSLLNAEKFPVVVPNSLFSSQVIVNKSRAQWRAMVSKIPLRIDNLEKVPQITEDIKSMLRSNAKVFLGKEVPYCFLSRIGDSYAELVLGCNLNHMNKDELYATEQDILIQTARIIKENGAALGNILT
ncbi:hypothetical protein GIB67_008318 [Kingdonia uniflora]|uniref:Mechanosensitive ion channel MscS domain-containing protein n=1 Tax=Kingdonia uniflora TaxID=39325 RepID=A0A7J7N4S0_9MAGN|nr:hypothetical protein GIB67_008318 [Kingdonia uniflora]